ncbi:MAG: mechanosensitive ion channel [Candidatus Omnitrophica bacterium]|nr:mechanosensitive ion channel [Candidatus Omnitrophota bacterium]
MALVGAAGLAVGFALQGSLANFAAGVMVILFQPFEVGGFIETSGVSFSTILVSPDNKRVIIPNAKITGDKIVVTIKGKSADGKF